MLRLPVLPAGEQQAVEAPGVLRPNPVVVRPQVPQVPQRLVVAAPMAHLHWNRPLIQTLALTEELRPTIRRPDSHVLDFSCLLL